MGFAFLYGTDRFRYVIHGTTSFITSFPVGRGGGRFCPSNIS